MPDGPQISVEALEKDGFGTNPPLFGCFVAEDTERGLEGDVKLVGYALYHYSYSTWNGRKLFLEDLYVSEKVRGRGIGAKLFKEVAKKTVADNCAYLEFSVLSWNPAQSFYKSWGCVNITDTDNITLFNLREMKIFIREARKSDCKEIRRLRQELANCGGMPDGPQISVEAMEKDGFETNPPLYGCFVAEDTEVGGVKIVGYALYHYSYSTWNGRKLFLEDLYVTENVRGQRIGDLLFKEVAKKTVADNCAYLEFAVLSWNPAQSFYKARGCENVTDTEHWNYIDLKGEALLKVAAS